MSGISRAMKIVTMWGDAATHPYTLVSLVSITLAMAVLTSQTPASVAIMVASVFGAWLTAVMSLSLAYVALERLETWHEAAQERHHERHATYDDEGEADGADIDA